VKVILPLALLGSDEQRAGPSPFVEVAGKPLVAHVIDQVLPLKPEEVVFIVGHHDRDIISFVTAHYSFKARFIKQKHFKGNAHAIYGAKKYVQGEVVVLFGDTLFKADMKGLGKGKHDVLIWVKEVDDPTNFGVVFLDGEYASKLIEKPDTPVSSLAMIGVYYFRDAVKLFHHIGYLLEHNIMTKGAFHLTDAIQLMINKKYRVSTRTADVWVDCGGDDGLLAANRFLLSSHHKVLGKLENSVVVKPVFIGKGAVIRDSVVGPFVSVSEGARVERSLLEESVIGSGAMVSGAQLSHSVVHQGAAVKGSFHRFSQKGGE